MLMRSIFKKVVVNIFCVTQKYCMPLFASTESPPSLILNGGFDKKVTKITVVLSDLMQNFPEMKYFESTRDQSKDQS